MAMQSGASFGVRDASFHCFDSQFVKVTWRPEIAQLRASRVVSIMDVGKIMNPTTARNQVEGAIVMGVGMALLEGNEYDERSGALINANFADYIVPAHADCPRIEVTFLEYPDYKLYPAGARGVGEIGLAGVAPAIANAIHHAAGVRIRHLPIRIEDGLRSHASALCSFVAPNNFFYLRLPVGDRKARSNAAAASNL